MASTETRFRGGYNAQLNRVLIDAAEKENRIFLNWFDKYYKKLYVDVLVPEATSQEVHDLYKELSKLRAKRYQEEPRHVKIPKIPEVEKQDPGNVRIMKPVSPRTLAILYRGLTNEGDGRKDYLKARNKLYPIEKYYGTLTTSGQYGWYLSKMDAFDKSPFGRKTIVEKSFYSRNGIGPSYYTNKPPLSRAPFVLHGI